MFKLHLSAIALLSLSILPLAAQTASRNTAIPRLTDGHPNLNGIWQAMNTANIDLLDHSSKQSPVMEMGALGAEPGGPGVVEGPGQVGRAGRADRGVLGFSWFGLVDEARRRGGAARGGQGGRRAVAQLDSSPEGPLGGSVGVRPRG